MVLDPKKRGCQVPTRNYHRARSPVHHKAWLHPCGKAVCCEAWVRDRGSEEVSDENCYLFRNRACHPVGPCRHPNGTTTVPCDPVAALRDSAGNGYAGRTARAHERSLTGLPPVHLGGTPSRRCCISRCLKGIGNIET